MLRLDIVWLMGTAWLARDPSSATPDWPPQPDRIFSALVASWGAGGELPHERAALEWLEERAPPRLVESGTRNERPAPTVFVPPNDPGSTDITILPTRRRRQPRRFPAASLDEIGPEGCHLQLIWSDAPPSVHLEALNDLAFRTSYIGHSSSLVRCSFKSVDAVGGASPKSKRARRAPYPGRLRELEELHARHITGDERARPRPSSLAGPAEKPAILPPTGFTDDPAHWIVFEHKSGERPDLRAAVTLCDTLRLALIEACGEQVPGWIAGHEADGSPARDAHMAIVPLAHVGFEHGDGRLIGLAIVPPKTVVHAFTQPGPNFAHARRAFRAAVGRLGETTDNGIRVLTLAPRGGGRWQWHLTPESSGRVSLDPARYLKTSLRWSSVTPVLLDRHLKQSGEDQRDEAVELVTAACTRSGLPKPVHVELAKYASIRGAPPAWPAGGNPEWLNWARKKSFGDRKLFHATLTFSEPVSGPVLVGAGRFVGLGLFLPVGPYAQDRGAS